MSDIFNRIKSGAGKVAKEADKAARAQRIEMQISSINKQVEEEYQKLGRLVYENNLVGSDEEAASSIMASISNLLSQIEEKRQEIEEIKEQADVSPPVAVAGEKKFCSECGAQNTVGSKFCASCGAKLQ